VVQVVVLVAVKVQEVQQLKLELGELVLVLRVVLQLVMLVRVAEALAQ
jgi:hypothetical protein